MWWASGARNLTGATWSHVWPVGAHLNLGGPHLGPYRGDWTPSAARAGQTKHSGVVGQRRAESNRRHVEPRVARGRSLESRWPPLGTLPGRLDPKYRQGW